MYVFHSFCSISQALVHRSTVAVVFLGLLLASPAGGAEFWRLEEFLQTRGFPEGMTTAFNLVSDDLTSAIGAMSPVTEDSEVLWWSQGNAPIDTGFGTSGLTFIPDGSGFYATRPNGPEPGDEQLVKWVPGSGAVPLENVMATNGDTLRFIHDVSYDGSRIVGTDTFLGGLGHVPPHLVWDSLGGIITSLGFMVDLARISSDGSTIAGRIGNAGEIRRWSQEEGFDLTASFGDGFHYVTDVSWDGTAIVGSHDVSGTEAWYWREGAGLTIIPELSGGGVRTPLVSPNGEVVFGTFSRAATTEGAAVWTEAEGVTPLKEYLVDKHGLQDELQGIDLLDVHQIALGGDAILGQAAVAGDPAGEPFNYIVLVSPIPEPSTAVLLALSAAATTLLRRQRRIS